MPTTIPRSHKAKVAKVRETVTQCRVFNLSNNFTGTPGNLDWVWDQYLNHSRGTLVDHGEKGYWIEIHSNCWYELS